MNIPEIKGLKYPDEYFIKFFFKCGLQEKRDITYLELGCSNGCNLTLPFSYENSVIGVDLNSQLIGFAEENFESFNQNNNYKFIIEDMRTFCDKNKDINADILIFASSIYYIPKDDFIELLRNIKINKLIKNNILFFLRFRELDDFRNHKGEEIEENGYILRNGITGEDGAFCKFYDTSEMIEILKKELDLRDFQTMSIKHENIQNGEKVYNSDVVIWGIIN